MRPQTRQVHVLPWAMQNQNWLEKLEHRRETGKPLSQHHCKAHTCGNAWAKRSLRQKKLEGKQVQQSPSMPLGAGNVSLDRRQGYYR
jgi:hypothetical protein